MSDFDERNDESRDESGGRGTPRDDARGDTRGDIGGGARGDIGSGALDTAAVERVLRTYGDSLPEDRLFDAASERELRAELRSMARAELAAPRETTIRDDGVHEVEALDDARREDDRREHDRREHDRRESGARETHVRRLVRRERRLRAGIAILAIAATVLVFLLVRPALVPVDPDVRREQRIDRLVADGARAFDRGEYAEARTSLRAAYDLLLESATDEAPADPARRAGLARRIGDVARADGDLDAAESFYREALDLRLETFPTGYHEVAEILAWLGEADARSGDLEGARATFERLGRLFGPEHRDASRGAFFEVTAAFARERQAELTRQLASVESSAEHFRRYVQMHEEARDDGAARPLELANLAHAYESLARIALDTDDIDTADAYFAKALAAREEQVALDPGNETAVRGLASLLRPMAEVARQQNDLVRCRGYLDRSIDLRLRMLEGNAEDRELRRSLAEVYGDRGQVAASRGAWNEARTNFAANAEIYESLARAEPGEPRWREELALAYAQLARVAEKTGADDEAIAWHGRVAEVYARLSGEFPENPRYRENLAACHIRLADRHSSHDRLGDAIERLESYVALYEELSASEPRNPRHYEHLGIGYVRLVELCERRDARGPGGGRYGDLAARYSRLAVHTYRWLHHEHPDNPIYRDMLLRAYELAGNLGLEDGHPDREYFEELLTLREEQLGPLDPLTARTRARFAEALVVDPTATREDWVHAEAELLEATRILRQRRQSTWEREALEALVELYDESRLGYPRKRAEIRSRLERIGE